MSLPRAVAPVPASAGAPPLQRRARTPATPVGAGAVGQCPRPEPDPPASRAPTAARQVAPSTATPAPARILPASCLRPARTHHGSPLRRQHPGGSRPPAAGAARPRHRHRCSGGIPALATHLMGTRHPQPGGTGPAPARGTDGTQPLQTRTRTEERCPEPPAAQRRCRGQHRGPIPARRGIALLPPSPAPRM